MALHPTLGLLPIFVRILAVTQVEVGKLLPEVTPKLAALVLILGWQVHLWCFCVNMKPGLCFFDQNRIT